MVKLRYRYEIGVDPGVNTGYAVWDREAFAFSMYGTADFWEVFWLIHDFPVEDTRVEIEMPKLNKRLFRDKYNRKGIGMNEVRKWLRIARNVGACGREAELMAIGLRESGYVIDERPPRGKKWSQKVFTQYTGITESVGENCRDACRFVFQK